MSKLKELRTTFGFTQKQLAEKLQTTQQTIQRWESGQTVIPVGHLKDIAVLFGCSTDELLGRHKRDRNKKKGISTGDREMPWGTFSIEFPFGSREYPIDERNRAELLGLLHSAVSIEAAERWIEFSALDNRIALVNPSFVRGVRLTTDDEEAMPDFANREAYKTLSAFSRNPDSVGPVLSAECEKVFVSLDLPPASSPSKRLEAAHEKLNQIEIVYEDGKLTASRLSDDVVTSVYVMQIHAAPIKPNTFLTVEAEEGVHGIVNLSRVALIEVPLEAYLSKLDDDGDASDGDDEG